MSAQRGDGPPTVLSVVISIGSFAGELLAEFEDSSFRRGSIDHVNSLPAPPISDWHIAWSHHAHVRQPTQSGRVSPPHIGLEGLAMKRSFIIFATVGAVALTGIASTMPAEARGGFGPGLAGRVIAGALIAGAASSAYAWAPGPGYGGPGPGYGAYGSYEGGPGYYAPYGYSYGGYDQSQHGGQPYYGR